MKYLISFLVLLFMVMAVSAQEVDTVKAKYYIDGHFYKELPAELRKSGSKFSGVFQLKDSTQHGVVFEIVLPAGAHLSEIASRQAIPDKNVFCRDLLLSTSEFYRLTGESDTTSALRIGDVLPDFSLKDIYGRQWTKQDLEGKTVLLNFWYTGCVPCIKEMPEISQWVRRFPKTIFLAVTYQPARFISPVVQKHGFSFHQLVEAAGFWKKVGIRATPTSLIVDKNGIVRLITVGTNEEKRKRQEGMLETLAELH